jgi:hypothetical protein
MIMISRIFFGLGITVMFFAKSLFAADLDKAPPKFIYDARNAVFADFSTVRLNLSFDAASGKTTASAIINFTVAQDGMPIFDLIPKPSRVELDGGDVPLANVFLLKDPDRQSTLRAVGVEVSPGQNHVLEIDYQLGEEVSYSDGAVAAGFFMSDLTDREYWEQYAPTNYEYDQYQQTVTVEVTGTDREHDLFVNGVVTDLGFNRWQIQYPSYFTSSSFYFHMAAKGRFAVERSSYAGINGAIPLTVYSGSQSNVSRGMTNLKRYLAELESTYGAFAHASFTAYITDTGGGMEYCGATITSLGALGHETTHSWFARGVMPANGNAGWIDEAIASWRDDGYPRGNGQVGTPRVLGGFSPYKRYTTRDAYSYGAELMADFDAMLASTNFGGLRNMLKDFFGGFKRQTITTPIFQGQMEKALGQNMQQFFDRNVYGKGLITRLPGVGVPEGWDVDWSRHPRPYTREEWLELR